MRFVLPLVAIALLASPSAADELINFWHASVYDPVESDLTPYNDFRVSINDTAYLLEPADDGFTLWRSTDGPAAAGFIAALTNGVNDPITFSNGNFQHTIDENTYFDDLDNVLPVIGWGFYPEFTANRIDLQGYVIDHIDIQFSREMVSNVPYNRYIVQVWGSVPEPGTILLMAISGFGFIGIRRR